MNERIHFRYLAMECCRAQLCWVNPRLPTHCPECGRLVYPQVKSWVIISDDNAHLRTSSDTCPYGNSRGMCGNPACIPFNTGLEPPTVDERVESTLARVRNPVLSITRRHGVILAGEIERLRSENRQLKPSATHAPSFQSRVWEWVGECFQRSDAKTPEQRAFRFIEEALELVQAIGISREDVLRLVDYTYNRPAGSEAQEIGGVMVTLAGLASSRNLDMNVIAEAELSRCVANTEKIRSKDLTKPERSPRPPEPPPAT